MRCRWGCWRMRWNTKAVALFLITMSAPATAQDKAPPLPDGVQATGPAGTSGAIRNYDDVGYAAVGAAASGTISATSPALPAGRSEEHTSELQSLMRISYAVFCLKKKKNN